MNLVHQLLHQENAQTTNSPGINICPQVRFDYGGWVKWFPVIPDYNGQAYVIGFTGTFNIPPIFSLISMFNDIGTCLINSQFDGISF